MLRASLTQKRMGKYLKQGFVRNGNLWKTPMQELLEWVRATTNGFSQEMRKRLSQCICLVLP